MRTSTKGLLATIIIASTLALGACQAQKQSGLKVEPTTSLTQNNQSWL